MIMANPHYILTSSSSTCAILWPCISFGHVVNFQQMHVGSHSVLPDLLCPPYMNRPLHHQPDIIIRPSRNQHHPFFQHINSCSIYNIYHVCHSSICYLVSFTKQSFIAEHCSSAVICQLDSQSRGSLSVRNTFATVSKFEHFRSLHDAPVHSAV